MHRASLVRAALWIWVERALSVFWKCVVLLLPGEIYVLMHWNQFWEGRLEGSPFLPLSSAEQVAMGLLILGVSTSSTLLGIAGRLGLGSREKRLNLFGLTGSLSACILWLWKSDLFFYCVFSAAVLWVTLGICFWRWRKSRNG
jgi:hypothetical protein